MILYRCISSLWPSDRLSRFHSLESTCKLDAVTVVGPHRLPDWDDQESLPYVNAIVKESLRTSTRSRSLTAQLPTTN